MKLEEIYREIKLFSEDMHGSSNYNEDNFFIMGENKTVYAPLRYLTKKNLEIKGLEDLIKIGFICDSYDLFSVNEFGDWYERQFSRKFTPKLARDTYLVRMPNNKAIFDAIEKVHNCYQILRAEQIIMNGKNLPIQLGEWYAKCIFGLKQEKSTSQRGFDFLFEDKHVEVKVNWSDASSPKGVKIKKSLVELSDYCIIIYMARNFMIREICFLDSEYVIRKYATKGHTIFLKDSDISQYFFSSSKLHYGKVVTSNSLMRYSSPTFALKLAEGFQ